MRKRSELKSLFTGNALEGKMSSVVGVRLTQNYYMTSEELVYTSLDHANRLDRFLNRYYSHKK